MRPIAAWLALWDDAVRGELIKREPETLLSLGDPGTLALGTRSELVRTFVAAYGEGGRRGLKIPTDAVRRLSRPELAPVIRECWGNGPENDEVREFLLDMIWLGAVDDCTDLARGAAREPDWPSSQRITAILALLACGRDATVRELAAAMLTEPAFWPDEIVHGVASNLFPGIITVEELATLMERSNEPQETADGFDWAARQIARAIEPWSEAAVALRDKLADLIWHEGAPSQEPYHMSGRFDHLVQALAILCDRQLSTCSQNPQADLIHACVVASRFGDRQTGAHEPLGHLRARFKSSASLRREYLWAELAFMGETTPSGDDQTALYFVQHFGLTGRLTEADRPWIEAALADDSHTERHPGSLHAWIQIWSQGERAASELCDMQRILNDNPYLVQILNEHTALQVRNNEIEKMKRYSREEAAADTDRETERLGTWRKWRDDMLADPVVAFSAEKRAATVSNLYAWLSASHQDRNRFNVWDKQALREAFGTDIAERAEQTFRGLWRTNELPVLWSARPIADRNETPYDWIYGLLGVSAESSTGGWTNSLSPDEARRAAVCATIELNGFAPFIANLAVSHPKEVEEMIGGEVSAELGIGDHHDSLPVLQNLTYANGDLKRLLTSRLLAELQSLPHTFTEETGPRWAYHLDQILRILNESGGVAEREAIAQKCVDRYEADPFSTVSLTWLQGLFRFDPLRGTQVLISRLASGNDTATREHATRAFASLFRGRDVGVFEIADPAQHARALEQLVRYAYSFIHPRDDQHQQGAYSPDLRDDAQSARNFLLSRLLDTPGREAWSVIRSLADAADFAHLSDHLHLRARQRAAADAEFAPFEPEAVVALEKRLEVPPHDRDGLFAVMLDRLNDLAYDLLHDDFTDRQTLKGVTEELEMQRILAQRIKTRANGAYKVTREEEVADQKRIDIRLLAINGDQKVAVEVKIADNWSLTRLEQALRNQLVGQYLRHNNCKAGCLLLTYNGEKGYWIHAETRKHVKFPEIIKLLNDKAQALQEEKLHDVRISVFGLDLTDPVLVSAHPAS